MNFPTRYDAILRAVAAVEPVRYGRTRNFIDGAVTRLSPYISRGVISTREVMLSVLNRGYMPMRIEKFIQELAWRDYWQRIWQVRGAGIDADLRRPQEPVDHYALPTAILNAQTGISAIDEAIDELYQTGYMHNHLRMYVAAIACNNGRSHWRTPARWMYFHLLDGDWASNALSWQWVAGSNSKKKYIANQENINKYCYTRDRGTFLDTTYDLIAGMPVPEILRDTTMPELSTPLPQSPDLQLDPALPTYIYNGYNLDPVWDQNVAANRVLLLEPSHFHRYPVSERVMDFIFQLAKNIDGLQLAVMEFDELQQKAGGGKLISKEHPLSRHYEGEKVPRDWMFDVAGEYPSFFAYWKKCKRDLKNFHFHETKSSSAR